MCFICGLERATFDKHATGGFEEHVRSHTGAHCMWNYLYFIVYLQEKDLTTFTGPEQYVFQLLRDKDLRWLPQHRCIALDQDKEVSGAASLMSELRTTQHDLLGRLTGMEAKLALLLKKLDSGPELRGL